MSNIDYLGDFCGDVKCLGDMDEQAVRDNITELYNDWMSDGNIKPGDPSLEATIEMALEYRLELLAAQS